MPNSKPAGFQPKYIRKINSLKGIFLFLLLHRGCFCIDQLKVTSVSRLLQMLPCHLRWRGPILSAIAFPARLWNTTLNIIMRTEIENDAEWNSLSHFLRSYWLSILLIAPAISFTLIFRWKKRFFKKFLEISLSKLPFPFPQHGGMI